MQPSEPISPARAKNPRAEVSAKNVQALGSFGVMSMVRFADADEGQLYLFESGPNFHPAAVFPREISPACVINEEALQAACRGVGHVSAQTLYVPILHAGSALGTFILHRFQGKPAFTQEDFDESARLWVQLAGPLQALLFFEVNLNEERLAALSRVSARVLHELRNIMQLAQISCDFMKRGFQQKKDAWLERGLMNSERALRELHFFSTDMLRLTLQDPLEMQSVPLRTIFEMLAPQFKDKAADAEIVLEFSISEDFPEIKAHAETLQRAIFHLIKNAVESADCEKPQRWIRVEASLEGDQFYTIRVSDNGQGMTPEIQQKLFRNFFSAKGRGTLGLGLALAARTVDAHHGRISFESELGKGTLFSMTMPLSPGGQ
ncbi:MAG: HAMP domain-containing histidine kinase [Candidatus Omnitrophica bacterium]|nr:HAMP domain-containing histidine kinase [Candidatus Omnitrophota bacterium]